MLVDEEKVVLRRCGMLVETWHLMGHPNKDLEVVQRSLDWSSWRECVQHVRSVRRSE